MEALVAGKTGLGLDPLFPAAKIGWLLDNIPAALDAAAKAGKICAGTIDSWLLFKLTGGTVHATDFSNALARSSSTSIVCAGTKSLAALFDVPVRLAAASFAVRQLFGA